MDHLSAEEGPLHPSFWDFQGYAETRVVTTVMRRRFPWQYQLLARSLEAVDPMDMVYPGHPNEYSDVILEVLVLLSDNNVDLLNTSAGRLERVIREGIERRFSESPEEHRVRAVVQLILAEGEARR
ncbi:hypothetical protein ACTMS2_05305 [Micromonospora sp. SD12]|uniref:hypothetical protein n=1 Tax=Micromonospora sp. SD12 TaxID=3452216 RepID=UPI003F8CCCB3